MGDKHELEQENIFSDSQENIDNSESRGSSYDREKIRFQGFHSSFAEFQDNYISSYIQFADLKSGVTLTVVVGVLGYLFSGKNILSVILFPTCLQSLIFATSGVALLSISAIFSFFVVFPRLSNASENIIYWRSIASNYKDGNTYAEEISDHDSQYLTKQRLIHCHDLANVCNKKYKNLIYSMVTGVAGLVSTVIWLALYA